MKTFIFKDVLTNEEFKVKCFPFEVHNLQNINEDFSKWSEGRILKYSEQ
jgi:hypothetical protein